MSTRMALSHSRLSDFNQCPLKFKLKYLDKAKNFQMDEKNKSQHLVRGDNVHKAIEKYVIKKNAGEKDIPPSSLVEVENVRPVVDAMFSQYDTVMGEQQISIDDSWQQVGWFDKSTFYRAIIDGIGLRRDHALVCDWKTGKFTDYTPPNGYGQLELTAGIVLALKPEIPLVTTAYVYVDHKKKVQKEYTQSDLPRLKAHFEAESVKVNSETTFAHKQNQFCNYCEATSDQCHVKKRSRL